MFIVLLTYVADLETVDALIPDHAQWLDTHYAAGDFIVSGRRVPRTGGVILAKTSDRAALEQIIAGDPFGQAGAATYEIIEFTPTKTAPDFVGLSATH